MRYMLLSFGLFFCASLAVPAAAYGSAPDCFHTAAEAAAQSGTYDAGGFRLESMEQDVFAEVRWARVRSCAQPAQPPVLMQVRADAVSAGHRRFHARPSQSAGLADAAQVTPGSAIMQAGRRVTLVIHNETMRLELSAVALANGQLGDRMKVRLEQVAAGGEERFAEGIVRGAGLVEVTQ